MEKKTIVIDVKTAEGRAELDKLEQSVGDLYQELQPLTAQIGELEDQLYEMANAGDTSSEAFKQMSTQVGKMKKVILDVDMQVDALSTTTGQKLGGAIGGLAGGFELAQGAMGAFGVESAKVEEALLKVNSAMAIAQGVQSVRESIPAFKALNSVVMANPIALLVTAFVALTAAAVYFASTTAKTVIDAFRKQSKASQEYRETLQKNAEVQNKSNEKILKQLDQEAARRISMGENATKVQKEINAEKIKTLKIAVAQDESDIRSLNAQKEKLKATRDETKEKLLQQVLDAKKAMADITQALYISQNQKIIVEAAKQLKELETQSAKDIEETNKQLTTRNAELEASKDTIVALTTEQINLNNEIKKGNDEAAKKRKEELDAIAEVNAGKLALETMHLSTKKAKTIESNAIDLNLLKEQTDAENKLKDEQRKKDAAAADALREAQFNAQLGLAKTGLSTLSELTDAFAGKDEASQKRAFNIKKAASIATTTIDTFQAAQGAYASQMAIPTPDAPIRAAIAAGLAIAQGLARVAVISKTKFGSTASASAGGGGGGSIPQPSASSPANFNIVGNSGTNQLVEGLANNPVQAYVVSGAVTTAQSLDRNQIRTATL